jgi:hypothetical protein
MSTEAIPYEFPLLSRQTSPDLPVFDPSSAMTAWLNGVQITSFIKPWVDPAPASDPVNYEVLNPDYTIGKLSMSARVAGIANVPGHPDYQPYSPAPSGATLNGAPLAVVSLADAQELATELGAAPGAITDPYAQFGPPFGPVYPAGDARRAYSITTANGVSVSVVLLLAEKYSNGVGSPGHWNLSGSVPAWVADLPSPAADAVTLPVPLGPIPAGATIIAPNVTFPNGALNLPDNSTTTTGGSGDSLFTPARAAIVDRLGVWLTKFGS